MEEKKIIRKQIFAKRKETSDAQVMEWSQSIAEKVIELEEFKNAPCIYIYVDYNREVSTRPIIEAAWKAGKKVAVPKVHGKDMVFYDFTTYDQLEPGYFDIPEPARGEAVNWEKALMFMPGVAFDPTRHRVGYGGGFYDRFLEANPKHPTIALAFDFQIVEAAPYEAIDILPGKVVTETKIYK